MIARLVDAPIAAPTIGTRRHRTRKPCVRCARAIRYGRCGTHVPASPSICFACYVADHDLHVCPCHGCEGCA